MSGLRVLHVVTRNQRRGAESFAVALSARLDGLGHASEVVALAPALTAAPLDVPVLGRTTLAPATLLRLRRRMREVDVVVAHGSRALPAVAVASAGLGRATMYKNIGDPRHWSSSGLRRLRVRLMLRRMSTVAALAEPARGVLRERYGLDGRRLVLLRNMRDATFFEPPTPRQRAAARAALGIDDERPIVAVVGSLSPEKRVDLAVRSVALLPGVHLAVVGDGPDRAAVEALAARLLPGRCTVVGSVPDVRPVLRASEAALLTSASEGVPGVLIEAGLCGLPVVTSDVGFVRDIVEHGVTGEVVDSAEPEAFAAALGRVLAERHVLGLQARRRCVERYDVERVTRMWSDALVSLADGAGGRVRGRVGKT